MRLEEQTLTPTNIEMIRNAGTTIKASRGAETIGRAEVREPAWSQR
jgi:hypothetical protein